MSDKYAVYRYFDDYYVGTEGVFDTEEEARDYAKKLVSTVYTSYEVKKEEAHE